MKLFRLRMRSVMYSSFQHAVILELTAIFDLVFGYITICKLLIIDIDSDNNCYKAQFYLLSHEGWIFFISVMVLNQSYLL